LRTQIILKLTHSCNFACRYCNYAKIMESKPGAMDLELVAEIFKKCSASHSNQEICFIFHGGEPLMVGLEYFRQIVALQKKYLGAKTYLNTIQTNGSLLSDDLVDFFKQNNFHLSISVDGPQNIHNSHRIDPNGRGTHKKIMEKIGLLHNKGISFSLLAVYSELMSDSQAIYSFFKSIAGLSAVDFLAMHNAIHFQKGYGRFLIDIFDIWFNDHDCNFEIRILNSMVRSLLGLGSTMCHFNKQCVLSANVIAIDPHGNVYPCDRELFTDFLLGNIKDGPIDSLLATHLVRKKFAMSQKSKNASCQFCEWYLNCGGGCPGDYDDFKKQNAYCPDYKLLFQHITRALKAKSLTDDDGKIIVANLDNISNTSLVNRLKSVCHNRYKKKWNQYGNGVT
jgi:uncharacterized protein